MQKLYNLMLISNINSRLSLNYPIKQYSFSFPSLFKQWTGPEKLPSQLSAGSDAFHLNNYRRRRADWLTANVCVDVCDQTVRVSANLGEF